MNRISDLLEKYLLPVAAMMSKNKYLSAVREGLVVTMPFLIFGSLTLLIPNLPYLEKLVSPEIINSMTAFLEHAWTICLNLSALAISFTIAYRLGEREKIEPIYAGFTGLFAFLMLIPFTVSIDDSVSISLSVLGAKGMFLAIIVAILAIRIYKMIRWEIKMPPTVPEAIAGSFSSLIPIVIVLSVFLLIRYLFGLTVYGNALDFIYEILQKPLVLLGNNFGSMLFAIFLIQSLWFFGLHGGMIVGAVYNPILMTLTQQNNALISAGNAPVNIINEQFYTSFFASLGGGSSFLALAIALLFFSKNKEYKEIGKLGIVPAMFNIAEPILFGLPVVMNPILFIPLVIGPLVTTPIAYIATKINILPIAQYTVPWTTPPILSGFISTGSFMGSLIQFIQIVILFFIWLICLRLMERQNLEIE